MKAYIEKLRNRENLTQSEIEEVMHEIMSGNSQDEDISVFLLALREKGPTVDEITGAAKIMRKFVVEIKTKHKDILDTCGTGGDKKNTFNISTVTALVVAGAGVAVAKHGNRSISSQCGSADLLEALGVNLNVEQEHLSACLDEVGIAFLFAQKLHPAMKNVAPVRKKLAVETIFNILGPLTNPAKATHQIMGVYSRDFVEPMAHVLKNLGLKRAIVVHGNDGMDEITTTDKTFLCEYDGKEIFSYDILPDELGIAKAKPKDLEGGDLNKNVRICKDILAGKTGPKRDIVLLNAAYALYVSQKVKDISQGMDLARKTIDSGGALRKLDQLVQFTRA
ncbi:MAG: anthranilate phosphoribosyltransferase [Candidatus Omnitrophica bacterium]|nr:anthranilate phosphoribosyltransferase [Candidatus Omnitrophota bacterium]